MRIVYVEDNIANVHLVKRVARIGKHEIINYIDGMDALNNFESDDPDLVLMDIQLAGELTGIEVVKKLREKGFETPIIAVTAYAMVGDKERCMEAGCTGYMSKPLPVSELVKLFQEYDKPKPSVPAEKAEPTTPTMASDDTQDTATPDDSPTTQTANNDDAPVKDNQVSDPVASTEPDQQPVEASETVTAEAPVVVNASADTRSKDADTTTPTEPSRQPLNVSPSEQAEGEDKLVQEDDTVNIAVDVEVEGTNSDPSAKMN